MKDSTTKRKADRLGISVEEYAQHLQNEEKWCYKCQSWKPLTLFHKDRSRGDGKASICATCNHIGKEKFLIKDATLYENDSEIDTHLLAYFAGVIDSDGYITIGRKNGTKRRDGKIPRYYELKVGCNQVDKIIPTLLRETFGGNFYTLQTKRQGLPWFMWYCSNQQAAHCCSLVFPYLQLKKKQAELSIEFNSLIKDQYQKRQGIQNISEEMELERDQLYWAIRQLNHTRNPRYNQIAGRFSDKGTSK